MHLQTNISTFFYFKKSKGKLYRFYLYTILVVLLLVSASILVQKLYNPEHKFFKLPNRIIKEVVVISSGDNLFSVLRPYKFSFKQIKSMVKSAKPHIDLTNLKLGQKWSLYSTEIGSNKHFKSLRIHNNLERAVEISVDENKNYNIQHITIPLVKKYEFYNGIINTTLLDAVRNNNVPYKNILAAINAHSYAIDFQRDIKKGDKFSLIIEKAYDPEDNTLANSRTIFSSLDVKHTKHNVYLLKMNDNTKEYVSDDYSTVKRSLLKTPVQATRISSKFGMRKHPVLGFSKMHTGVDFAAPRGSLVYAAGSGKIRMIGRRGGYGKYIKIKHNPNISTAYAHLSSYAKGLRAGHHVKQGQIIGKVGSTGRATGPHLHYEVIVNGKQVNPMSVRSKPSRKLHSAEKNRLDSLRNIVHKISSVGNNKKSSMQNQELKNFYANY